MTKSKPAQPETRERPRKGGSYWRDKDTGALTRSEGTKPAAPRKQEG